MGSDPGKGGCPEGKCPTFGGRRAIIKSAPDERVIGKKRGGGGGGGATDKNLLGADGGREVAGQQWTPGGYTGTSDGSYGMVH